MKIVIPEIHPSLMIGGTGTGVSDIAKRRDGRR